MEEIFGERLFNKYKRRKPHIFEHRTLPSEEECRIWDRGEGKGMISWMSLTNQSDSPRRIRVYVFSMDLMFHLLNDGVDNIGLQGWPKDAEIIESAYDRTTWEMYAIVEHDDFAEVEPNGLIPRSFWNRPSLWNRALCVVLCPPRW